VDETLGLPESIRSTVSDVLQQYTAVFTKSENDRGVSYVVTHKIDTGGEDIQEDHGLQQEAHSGVSGFFGGSADYQGSECESTEVVYSVVAGKDESSSVGQTNGGKVPEDRKSLSWPHQGLSTAQRAVPDTGFVMELTRRSRDRPEWEEVALSFQCVNTSWNQWPHLFVQGGLLNRHLGQQHLDDNVDEDVGGPPKPQPSAHANIDFNSDVSTDCEPLSTSRALPARRRVRPKHLTDFVC